ncbi:VCBS repeat-containing protein [Pseudenhygromyxa sp. WMMC2535]|uniref:FG-GAP repeat domain-containing protein n=1 Tax=Pseudenhygromyxa sp. WMMC2535 TaxID=2712867 RepID=UPI001554CBF7|nr:VCBS repeat-containing protein [Pseudenhygromyxa sp. WMMC2535]NVB39406.1 VCBS repeat-containing protein [Pseudenhygromyxa sp. WMMC2535]
MNKPSTRTRTLFLPLSLICLAPLACGDDGRAGDDDDVGLSGSGGESESGTDEGADEASTTFDTLDEGTDTGPECFMDADCVGGVCLGGACCDTESTCGDVCCGDAEVCLFDSCITPGSECTTADDCGEDQYCELGLGEPSPGPGTPPEGLSCTLDLPATGKCVDLPVVCTGSADDPEDCVEACEVMAEAQPLNAVAEWQWGLESPLPEKTDIWSTPTVARVYDANCDGEYDENDPPNVVFVSGNSNLTCCSCDGGGTCKAGDLNLLDGRTGEAIWTNSLPEEGSTGWSGVSVAIGDIDGDARLDVIAATGEGKIAMVDSNGVVQRISDQIVGNYPGSFGWGGGIAISDMDHDGYPEIAYGRTLFSTTDNAITRLWVGTGGTGGGTGRELSHMADVDGNGIGDLIAGNTVYNLDGSILWQNANVNDGFTAIGDTDQDGQPELVVVRGDVWILDAATGTIEVGPVDIPFEETRGGPPTIADFDGDGVPEIGIAGGTVYVVYESDLSILWQHETKDTSSAVTGSSVFDFEGDGSAEVVYSDECFLRVLDGSTGELRFAAPNTTFTATEALIVADVDGDGSAEIARVSNSANWNCNTSPWIDGDPETGLPAWVPPSDTQSYYRGLTIFGSADSSWVGTRTVWNQHAYNVTNVCDSGDGACLAPNLYGGIPSYEQPNWLLPWLNNFRQNVLDDGVFDAPNATVDLDVACGDPMIISVKVRNVGLAPLPAGVQVEVRRLPSTVIGTVETTKALYPGQIEVIELDSMLELDDTVEFEGEIIIDPENKTFVECKEDDNTSEPASAFCGIG